METDERIIAFLKSLLRLAAKEDRGALADLRSGLRTAPGQAPRMHKHVVPYLDENSRRNDRWFYVVGAMFGANPNHVPGNGFGKCFKILSESGSDSIEARFLAIVGAHRDDLHSHLYHAIRLLQSHKPSIGVDYRQLLRDLILWDTPEKSVQNRWARDYYYRKLDDTTQGEDNDE